MKILTLSMPEDADVKLLAPQWQQMLIALSVHWNIVGRKNNRRKMANALVNDQFKVAGELDNEGNPVTPSLLPKGWELITAHKVHKKELARYDANPDVVVDAADITDTEVERRHHYPRYYVRSVTSEPEPPLLGLEALKSAEPVITGVRLLDRMYNEIEVIDGAVPDAQGGYTKKWMIPAKDVLGVGKVDPEALEADGSYIHKTFTKTVLREQLEELVPITSKKKAKYLKHMPDEPDEVAADGKITKWKRPAKMKEISALGGYKRKFL